MKILFTFLVACSVHGVMSSPMAHHTRSEKTPGKVLYNQRQDGKYNLQIGLKDIEILVITGNPGNNEGSGAGADALINYFRLFKGLHSNKQRNRTNDVTLNETVPFLEAKTAPYHVDITQSSTHLLNDEILATQSPPDESKSQSGDVKSRQPTRLMKALLVIPREDLFLVGVKRREMKL